MSNYYANRETNRIKAEKHTGIMEDMYPKQIESCVAKSRIYGVNAVVPVRPYIEIGKKPEIIFANTDTVTGMFNYKMDKTAILNFASYKNPGGMFLNGSSAQEECLCHASFLYNVLRRCSDYYEWNNLHKNRAQYMDRAIYTPDIVFTSRGVICDVITCAAPNYTAGKKYGHVTKEENSRNFRGRIRFIRDVAEAENVDTLIAGAYGCGVFGQDPEEAAAFFAEAFKETSIKRIVYAVPGHDRNAEAFRHAFATRKVCIAKEFYRAL